MPSANRSCCSSRSVLILIMAVTVFNTNPVLAGESPDQEASTAPPPSFFGLGLLDRTQTRVSNSADALANQLDRFFGVQRSDIEAAYSALRVSAIQSWNKFDDYDYRMKLRGKIYLPGINERISLIFSGENADGASYNTDTAASVAEQQKTRINLELNLAEQNAHHLFFRVGASSGLKPRYSMRYRYEPAAGISTLNRFIQSVYYQSGAGVGSLSRYQLDHIINEDSLIRSTNDLRLEERVDGIEYTSTLEYLTRRSGRTALSWYGRVNGVTRPGFIKSYDVGFRIRKNVAREWLFLELEPGFTWRKDANNLPRKSAPYIFVRLEMALGTYN